MTGSGTIPLANFAIAAVSVQLQCAAGSAYRQSPCALCPFSPFQTS
jgi:hypothetical protein